MQLFQRNYATPGPGIDPNAPEKFGLARFAEILTIECGTLLKLNLMTLAAAIPIVTAPAAICAMNAVIRKMVLDEPVSCFQDFRQAFALYWKQSYLLFLLGTVVPILSGIGSFFYACLTTTQFFYFIPCIFCLFTSLTALFSSAYLYPLLSMEISLKEVIRHSFFLGIGKPLRAFFCFAVNFGLMGLAIWFFPLSLPYLLLIGLTIPCLIGQFLVRLNLRKFAVWHAQKS